MPERINLSANAKTPKEIARARESEKLENRKKRYREMNRDLRKIDISDTPTWKSVSDKPMKHHARQSMRFDKELPMHPYSVSERGRYWHEDVATTLAVITHARMIIASRKKRLHEGEDTRFLIG